MHGWHSLSDMSHIDCYTVRRLWRNRLARRHRSGNTILGHSAQEECAQLDSATVMYRLFTAATTASKASSSQQHGILLVVLFEHTASLLTAL
jgi:hypothetical protein